MSFLANKEKRLGHLQSNWLDKFLALLLRDSLLGWVKVKISQFLSQFQISEFNFKNKRADWEGAMLANISLQVGLHTQLLLTYCRINASVFSNELVVSSSSRGPPILSTGVFGWAFVFATVSSCQEAEWQIFVGLHQIICLGSKIDVRGGYIPPIQLKLPFSASFNDMVFLPGCSFSTIFLRFLRFLSSFLEWSQPIRDPVMNTIISRHYMANHIWLNTNVTENKDRQLKATVMVPRWPLFCMGKHFPTLLQLSCSWLSLNPYQMFCLAYISNLSRAT